MTTGPHEADRRALHDILATEDLQAVYQPVVALQDGAVVGYEALARGPAASPLERPDRLFAVARHEQRLAELDHLCRATAFAGALEAELGRGHWLHVNVEPAALDVPVPDRHADVVARATSELDVVVEITERMLTAHPAALLDLVEDVRARGWRIALDDVGADPASLALMPLLRPDVIKLDLRIVQKRPSLEIAHLVSACNAEVERSGAVLLAEGIETEQHLDVALSLGAAVGQGWLFGRPAALPAVLPPPRSLPLPARTTACPAETPADIVSRHRTPRIARKDLLVEISKHLEREASALGESAIVLSTFQHARHFTEDTVRRYGALARRCSFTAALGEALSGEPAPGVRGADLALDDPLCQEWDIAVLGPHFSAALTARDLGDTGPEAARRFAYVLTYDRDLVRQAASVMMRRIPSTLAEVPEPATPLVLAGR